MPCEYCNGATLVLISFWFMDLTNTFPRSPFEKLGGMIWIPRLTDKARAKLKNKLGEYVYDCPMDQRALKFLGIGADAFLSAVSSAADDKAMLEWIGANAVKRSPAAIEEFNKMLSNLGPSTPDSQTKFAATRDKIAAGRTDVTTWAMMIDLEEGRLK